MSNQSDSSILVVDDQVAVRSILRKTLEQKGYAVIEASNGLECLKILHEKIIKLLILDLVMPMMDGLETMKKIHAVFQDKEIPVIVITGFANKETILQMHKLGCIDFLTKPFSSEEVLKRVAKYFSGQQYGLEKTEDHPGENEMPVLHPVLKAGVKQGSVKTDAGNPVKEQVDTDENPNEIYKLSNIEVEKLQEGMVLGGDLQFPKGTGTLASDGVILTARMIGKIRELGITSVPIKNLDQD